MNYLVIYPGRFHPFHRGHRASYEYLAKKYGADHVYIATTGVQAPVTSPFTFADKVKMITTLGIPAGHVVKVTNPYQSREITDSIPTEEKSKTVLIFALSAKDAERFSFAPKKDGTPSYLQSMPANLKQLTPMTEHAYVEITPTVNFKVRGQDANSASQIRSFYIKGNNNDRDQVIADLYGEAYPELRDIFDNQLGVSERVQNIVREAKLLNTTKSIALIERILTKERRALNEFSVNSGDDGSSDDPYQYPKPEHYARSIDYFGQFEAEHFDEEDMNDATGEFKGYWYYDGKPRQIAYFKFDNPERTGSNHPGMGWYYEPQNEGIAEAKRKKKKKTSRSLGRYFFPGYGYYGSGESGEGGGDGGGEGVDRGMAEAEKTAKIFHPQYVDVYFLNGPRRTPTLVNRRVPYNLIDRYLKVVVKKYNLHQGRFEFRNAEEPHMAEEFRPTDGQAMNIRRQTAQKMNPVTDKFVWKRPNQIGGSHSENELKSLNFKYSTKYNMWGGTQQMWDRLSGALKESTDYLEEK